MAGARLRDKRNGMTIPPALTPRTVLDALPRARWWFDFLTTEPLSFASLDRWSGTVAELLDSMFDPTVTFDDLAWITAQWPGKVVVKGIQTVADARRVTRPGRRRHRAVQPRRPPARPRTGARFTCCRRSPPRSAVDTEILLDTGIMSGADIVAAIALGARFTLIGRAYLYGLMAGGEAGVNRAIAILAEQVTRTMRLLGVSAVGGARRFARHATGEVGAAGPVRSLGREAVDLPVAGRGDDGAVVSHRDTDRKAGSLGQRIRLAGCGRRPG